MEEESKAKNFLVFQSKRKIISLCKNFLVLLEDAQVSEKCIPDEVYQKIRKRVLDYGNDAIRDLEENYTNFDIIFK